MCSNKKQTATTSTSPPSDVLSAYQSLMSRAQGVANTPYQAYGQTYSPLQSQAFQGFSNDQQYLPQAQSMINAGASPITGQQIQSYENPFQNQVINATMGNINETNQQQHANLIGNALPAGGLNNDRLGVAEGELARQQSLASNQTFAGLNAQNYQQGLAAAQADRAAQAQGGYQELGLSNANAGLLGAQLGAGATQYGQPYAQFQQQQAFPYQQTGWLAGIDTGVGSQSGGTSQTQYPGPNPIAQWGGLGLTAAGMFLKRGGRIRGYALGGSPFQADPSPYGGQGYIPGLAIRQGSGPPRAPNVPQQQSSNANSMISSAMGLANKIKSGLGTPANQGPGVLPGMGGITDPNTWANAGVDTSSGLGGIPYIAQSQGGAVEPSLIPQGYDDGGTVDPDYASAISGIESSGNYGALGPVTKTGDRAYGKYQVMGNNIPQWSESALGKKLTPQEFLADSKAQDAVFQNQFGSYLNKTGNPQDAASMWFTGKPLAQGAGASDQLGTTGQGYVNKFNAALGQGNEEGLPPDATPAEAPGIPPMPSVDSGSDNKSGLGLIPQSWKIPMIAAGFGMMASRSPFLGSAIGEGGMQGLNAYAGQQQEAMKQRNIDLQAKRLDDQATKAQKALENQTLTLQENMQHHRTLENQGNYQMLPGQGIDTNTGETVPGSYIFDKKKGTTEFRPQIIQTGKGATTPAKNLFAPPPDTQAPVGPSSQNAVPPNVADNGIPSSPLNASATKKPVQVASLDDPEINIDPSKPLSSDQLQKGQDYYSEKQQNALKVAQENIHAPGTHPEVLNNLAKNLGPDGPGWAATIKAVAEGRQLLTSIPQRTVEVNGAKISPRDLVERGVNLYKPGWEQSEATQRANTIKDLAPNGTTGKLMLGVNQLLPHIKTLSDATAALDNGNYPAFNKVTNWIATQSGQPQVLRFNAVRDVAALDAARILRGAGAFTEQEIEHWRENIGNASSPAQLNAVFNTLATDLMGARINSIRSGYKILVGKDAPDLMSDEAKEALKVIQSRDASQQQDNKQQPAQSTPAAATQGAKRVRQNGHVFDVFPDGSHQLVQ